MRREIYNVQIKFLSSLDWIRKRKKIILIEQCKMQFIPHIVKLQNFVIYEKKEVKKYVQILRYTEEIFRDL